MATVLNENIEIYQDYVFSKRKILIQGNVHSDSQRYLKIYYRKLLQIQYYVCYIRLFEILLDKEIRLLLDRGYLWKFLRAQLKKS